MCHLRYECLEKRTHSAAPPPKIVCEQRNVGSGSKVIPLAERCVYAARVEIAVEDE
jgi:hypothetical protein